MPFRSLRLGIRVIMDLILKCTGNLNDSARRLGQPGPVSTVIQVQVRLRAGLIHAAATLLPSRLERHCRLERHPLERHRTDSVDSRHPLPGGLGHRPAAATTVTFSVRGQKFSEKVRYPTFRK